MGYQAELTDTRWSDPNKMSMTNGPIRTISPPASVQVNFRKDMQLIEFMLPFPMHIVDPDPWPVIEGRFKDRQVLYYKPVMSMKGFDPDGRIGNESPDAYCTILRVTCDSVEFQPFPQPRELWRAVQRVCEWIRIKARHHWLLHGQTGFGAVFRGTIVQQMGNRVESNNFATYVPAVLVKPLSKAVWESIGAELQSPLEPPVHESLFCDALLSAAAGEETNAILQLGVAAEIAITNLLLDAAGSGATTPPKRKFIAKGERESFYEKLGEWPAKLGLLSANSFNPKGGVKQWQDTVKELYSFRGSVAHTGRVKSSSVQKHISSYVFATNVLFRYCREQRIAAGLPIYSYPTGEDPADQLVAFTDAVLDSVAGSAVTTLPVP